MKRFAPGFLAATLALATSATGGALSSRPEPHAAAAEDDVPLKDWPAPRLWTATPAASDQGGRDSAEWRKAGVPGMEAVSLPAAYVAVTPCRIADTRLAAGTFGGPAFYAQESRTFPIPSGPCPGLPATAVAWSLNVTAVPTPDTVKGYIIVWPTGQPRPVTSSLNATSVRVVANTVIAAAGAGGAVDVFSLGPVHLVIDINGYFAADSVVTSVNSLSGAVDFAGSNGVTVQPIGGPFIQFAAPAPGPGLFVDTGTHTTSVVFGLSGSSTSAARADHTSFGQSWGGGALFGLDLLGSHPGGTWLNLGNSSGNWWNLISTGTGNGEGAGKFLIRDGNQVAVQISPGGVVDVMGQVSAPNLPRYKAWSGYFPDFGLDLAAGTFLEFPSGPDGFTVQVPGPGALVFTAHAEVDAYRVSVEMILEDLTNGIPSPEVFKSQIQVGSEAYFEPLHRETFSVKKVVPLLSGGTRKYLLKFNNLLSNHNVGLHSASLVAVWYPLVQAL